MSFLSLIMMSQVSISRERACRVLVTAIVIAIELSLKAMPGLAVDTYPWINTFLYENIKETSTYTDAEADAVADRYDIAVAHLQVKNDRIQQRNPDIRILPFTGFGELSTCSYCLQRLALFFQTHPEYYKEEIYLHYRCDTLAGSVMVPGCNVLDWDAGTCTGTAAPGCLASTAASLSQSHVPDLAYQDEGWTLPNFNSETYRAFVVWEIPAVLSYYNPPPHGIFQDNILKGSVMPASIENTIEYAGNSEGENDEYHQYRVDQHAFYDFTTAQTETAIGRELFWAGNANHMWWIRSKNTSLPGDTTLGPFYERVVNGQNLDIVAVENWNQPDMAGEFGMPSWATDCAYLADAWNHTVNHPKEMVLITYNWMFSSPDPDPDPYNQAFSLASYYLVKNPRLYYSYSIDFDGDDIMGTEWNPMAEADIGLPVQNPPGYVDFDGQQGSDKYFDWNNPAVAPSCTGYDRSNVVRARYFENGLVLARYKGVRCTKGQYSWPGYCDCGPSCSQSYQDPRVYGLANPYGSSYYAVQPDGTLSADPVTSISLKTNEAVVLIKAECQEGSTQSCITSDSCSGVQSCVSGEWGSCVKDDLCCGVNCDDSDPCTIDTCSAGSCSSTPGTFHPADQNCNSGVETSELQAYVSLWMAGQGTTTSSLIEAMSLWKNPGIPP